MFIDEAKFCLGPDCPDKQCEKCWSKKTIALDITDKYRSSSCISKSGYYSSGGIIVITDSSGKKHYAYARNYGD